MKLSIARTSVISIAACTLVPIVRAETKPNIVVILADDLGFADVGFNNSKDIKTPNIDSLAVTGVRFTSFYTQPMCTPARAAFLTGRYPIRYGLQSFVITIRLTLWESGSSVIRTKPTGRRIGGLTIFTEAPLAM